MSGVDFAQAEIVSELPARLRSDRGEPFPGGLVGAEVVAIGTLADHEAVEGGGLVVDYRAGGEGSPRRIVFGFNELGMWVEYQGECAIGAPAPPAGTGSAPDRDAG